MSTIHIRAALETALSAMLPALPVAWENVAYNALVGVPYQRAYCLFARPANPTIGQTFHREQGIFQVTLCYPLNGGPGDAFARAELIKSTFYRGQSFTQGGVTTIISETPEIGAASPQADSFRVPVRVRFYADIFTN